MRAQWFAQGAFAVAGLAAGLASLRTVQPKHAQHEGPVVLATDAAELRSVALVSGPRSVTIERKQRDGASYLWVTLRAAGRPDLSAPASRRAEGVFESYSPLRARRGLGQVDAKLLENMGLGAAAKEELRVVTTSSEHVFQLGATLPEGDRRLMAPGGHVFLIPQSVLFEIDEAVLLVEPRLHRFPLDRIDRVEISATGAHPLEAERVRTGEGKSGFRRLGQEAVDGPLTEFLTLAHALSIAPRPLEPRPDAKPLVTIRYRGEAEGILRLFGAGSEYAGESELAGEPVPLAPAASEVMRRLPSLLRSKGVQP